ncbi:MAG: PKD domain-containing protein, partial [Bacteroidetes bacterium]|nr:PKD domain-containing protein [Bacteroidota bacterium]
LTVNSGNVIWYFPGGTPSTSTNRFQKVTYSVAGVYAVKLVCTNLIGTDSITKIDYITVLNAFNMCGSFDEVFLSSGNLYDPGGVNGNSTGSYYCDFLIDPGCASSITLTFSTFSIGSGNYLYIYNRGPNIPTGSTLLYTGTGNFMPPPITANGGKMLVRFVKSSSGSVTGFAASWTSALTNTQIPVAAFTPDNFIPPLNTPVRLLDFSLGEDLNYAWDFGDGTSSTNNPTVHEYSVPGNYTITLIAMNCLGADTLSQNITVQQAPAISVSIDTIDLAITCGDSITIPVNVNNNGSGDLLISENGYTDMDDTIHVLAYINHSDTASMVNPIVGAIAQYFNKFTVTYFNSNDTSQLRNALVNKHVLLFPERGNDPDTMYSYYPDIVLDYIRNGGNVVVCGGANSSSDPRLNDMSLLRAKYLKSRFASSFTTSDTTDILTDQIPYFFPQVTNRCYPFTISNRNKKMLISNNGDDILTYRYYGKGKAVHMGFSVKNNSPDEVKRVMSNCIKMAQHRWPDWLDVLPEIDTIHAGDSTIANFVIKPIKLKPGLHYAYINFISNDPIDSIRTIVLKINVTGLPILTFADTCFDFGIVTLGDSSTQYVTLENSGCDTLFIDSISTSSTVITTNQDSISMQYSSTYSFPVHFHPQALGNFTDTLSLYTNIGLIKHCISGTGVTAPAIAVSTTSLTLSHNACGDSATTGFWFYNTGGNYLNYTLSAGNDSIPRKILTMVSGVDMQNEYQNTMNSIQQYFGNIIADTTIFTTSAAATKLLNKDIVLFPKQETGITYVTSIRPTIQQFVNGGGNVIFFGSDFHTNLGLLPLIYQMNMFTGSDTADIISGTCLVSDTTDFYTENINQTFPAISKTYLQKITNTDKLTLVTSSDKDVISVRKYGKGNAIYIGFDYDTFNPDIQKIIAGTVKNIYRGKFPKGIQLFPDSGTVAPGDSVYITINSTLNGLSGGQYSLPIVINGNSSFVENDTVFSQFQIGYNPCADFTFFNTTACNGTMSFTDLTYNPGTSWKWFFGDGDSSLLQSPTHTYTSAGVKTVTFITTNAFGTDTIIKNCSVTLLLPVLNVTGAPVVGNALIFTTNLSQSIYTRFWDFGDGATSSLSTATHAYASPGTYIVTLTLTSTSCTMIVIDTVYITPTALSEFIIQGSFNVHPNPFRNQSEIRFELTKSATIDLAVIDVSGRVLEQYCKNELKPKGIYNFKFGGYPTGMYSVLLKVNGFQLMQKLVKEE